ncbi:MULTISPECIES: CLCA_X family protein [Reinekea]|uniref:CLCA_X family protein n=1 Tax=Reinekea TaxID=230494 RepID=UPI002357E54C|nr:MULTISPECIES: CLCA_X family protein [Reinekea]
MSVSDQGRFYRNGQDHRGGWLVSFADVHQSFGFNGVRIGRWVTAEEKAVSAPLFYDALADLMSILAAPAILISLRGTLSLEYGTGGQWGVAAHYTPAMRAFALAKNAGPGSIAHEWFHAFDHYIAGKSIIDPAPLDFASSAWTNQRPTIDHPLNQLLFACFEKIFYQPDSRVASPLLLAAQQADRRAGRRYYSLPAEMCARAFEAFVQDAAIKNTYLVKGTRQSAEAELGLYPKATQRSEVNRAFARYFSTLGALLHKSPQGSSAG